MSAATFTAGIWRNSTPLRCESLAWLNDAGRGAPGAAVAVPIDAPTDKANNSAVLSFAFGQRAAILDTNVARVLFRVFIGRGQLKAHAMRRQLWSLSRTLLPVRHVFDFNQALMDFGATVCTARKPQCLLCPMRSDCAAYPFNPDNERG